MHRFFFTEPMSLLHHAKENSNQFTAKQVRILLFLVNSLSDTQDVLFQSYSAGLRSEYTGVGRPQPCFSELHRPQPLQRESAALPFSKQPVQRLLRRIVRKPEGIVMHRYKNAPPDVDECLHRLLWRHMRVAHEPLWLVRSDRNQGDMNLAVPRADFAEDSVIAAVAGKIQAIHTMAHHPAAPMRRIRVPRRPPRPMFGRHEAERYAANTLLGPPRKFLDSTEVLATEPPGETLRYERDEVARQATQAT